MTDFSPSIFFPILYQIISYLAIGQVPVESESVSDQLASWWLTKIRAQMVANDIPERTQDYGYRNLLKSPNSDSIGSFVCLTVRLFVHFSVCPFVVL